MVRFHTRLQEFYNGETGKHSGQGLKEYVYCKTKMPKGPKPPQSSIGSIPIYSSFDWFFNSLGECFLDMEEVDGSIPSRIT
jgi:hypothetical protein